MDVLTVKNLINSYAGRGEPFVFGLNYACTEGFFHPRPLEQTGVLWEMDGTGNASLAVMPERKGTVFQPQYISRKQYETSFDVIMRHLRRGDTFLANLTARTPVDTDYSFEEIFLRSRSRFRILLPGHFVCFSPEIFVNICPDGRISSHPMKGTISALVEDAGRKILEDYKETAEHMTIVDFIRSDLSRISRNVHVRRLRYIDTIVSSKGPVLQVSSEICGQLPDGWRNSLGDLLTEILPAGSISGAPKYATVKAIEEAEQYDRDYYTGIFGYFDGSGLKTAVLIRYIGLASDGRTYFYSGGGITVNSRCEDEYKELCDKVYVPWM